ncbi:YcaO-like family protein [Streptomyces sp. BF23-30]
MTSSLRTVPLADTLIKAKAFAAELGVTRVTDTTWLDCIGVPVYSSIRPDAVPNSLCVNAGKGVHPDEAKVGAYMEAIEFALAEYRNRSIEVVMSTPGEVMSQKGIEFDFVDLCPILGRQVDADGPLACVEAEDIATGNRILLPAELAFSPFSENPGQRIFGTSTNGLSSGNTVAEATLHGLCEVIERDTQSFNFVRDKSRYVHFDHPSENIDILRDRIVGASLQPVLRYTPSRFGIPYFQGFILESSDEAPIAISQGAGLHLIRDIAAVRALAEAAQSRLSYIHGGRDDLIERYDYFANQDGEVERQATSEVRSRILNESNSIAYSEIASAAPNFSTIDDALQFLRAKLAEAGIRQVFRVRLSSETMPLAVVKVIVPKLEHFQPTLKRVGPRLVDYMDNKGSADEQV